MRLLFEPLKLRNLTIKNRIAVPPMVVYRWADDTGYVTDRHIEHYRELAQGGAGLIIQEATCIARDGRLADSQLGIWEDGQIEGLKKITDAVHRHGTPILVEIHHAGAFGLLADAVCPSDITCTVREEIRQARAMTLEELHTLQQAFADAAVRAAHAGYDGVELHACHNYLISQFLNREVNRRTDAYGANPALFALEIIREIRRRTPASFIIGIRLGAFEPTLADGIANAVKFAENGGDFLDVSYGFDQRSEPFKPENYPFSDRIYAAAEIKKHVSVPVFAVGEITSAQLAEQIRGETGVDMVDIGRGSLVNPNWANDAQAGHDTGSCLYCRTCMWRIDADKCPGRLSFNRKYNR